MARIDVSPSQAATAAGVQSVITNQASNGDEIALPAGTFNWSTAVTNAGKNLYIHGASAKTTIINAPGPFFNITCQLNSSIMRLSAMTLTSGGGVTILLNGTAVVNASTFTGGCRLDHLIFNGSNPGHTVLWNSGSWIEGLMDHCIIDQDPNVHHGETLIVNHAGSPLGTGGWNWGDYSWSHAMTPGNDVHMFFFEDNIFKRCSGNVDTNGIPQCGGARIVSRHNTNWGQPAGGHGTRESGGVRLIAPRLTECYKNLCVRGKVTVDQSQNFFSARSGEWICWGNRLHRYGNTNIGQVSSPLQAQNYLVSSQRPNDAWLGPNGANPWDLNQKGPFTISEPGVSNDNTHYDPTTTVASAQIGDIYAEGTGGLTCVQGSKTITGSALNYHGGGGYWNDFTLVNLALDQTGNVPVPFAYITGTTASSLQIYTSNVYGGNAAQIAENQFFINSGQAWCIRRVRKFFGACGLGTMDASPDSNTTGKGNVKLVASAGTPNPRWCNQLVVGISQWNNKYRTAPGAYTQIQNWQSDNTFTHSIGGELGTANIRDGTGISGSGVHPGYGLPDHPYVHTAGSPSNQNTRVGADDEAWAMAPFTKASIASADGVGNATMYDSVYEDGVGGYTYPHPLISGGVVGPSISGPDSATVSTSSSGVQTLAAFVASDFGGAVTWSIFAGSLPANVTLKADPLDPTNTAKRVIATTSDWPTGNVAGDTDVTIRAALVSNPSVVLADAAFKLKITSPNQAPTDVAVTSPADGATFTASATITLKSKATDSDGNIVSMKYFYGTNTEITTVDATQVPAPYEYTWAGVTAGTYAIKVTATDNQTGATTSSAVTITVNPATSGPPPPTIVVTA